MPIEIGITQVTWLVYFCFHVVKLVSSITVQRERRMKEGLSESEREAREEVLPNTIIDKSVVLFTKHN